MVLLFCSWLYSAKKSVQRYAISFLQITGSGRAVQQDVMGALLAATMSLPTHGGSVPSSVRSEGSSGRRSSDKLIERTFQHLTARPTDQRQVLVRPVR